MRNGCRIFAVRVSDFLRSGVSDRDEIFTEQEMADRDISARIVKRHLEIPTAQLPFAPKCLLANGLSLSS